MANLPGIVSFMVLFASAYASAATPENQTEPCLTQHLREAISLNSERSQTYSDLTKGDSLFVSQVLMTSEKLGLLGAAVLEYIEAPLRNKGLSILCEDVVSMSQTPPMPTDLSQKPDQVFDAELSEPVRKSLLEAWSIASYRGLWQESLSWLETLEEKPAYHCMVRHLVESIGMAAARAPSQLERAVALGHERRARIVIDTFLRSQIDLLSTAHWLDKQAAPIQAEGLPIICRDVPHIPVPKTMRI